MLLLAAIFVLIAAIYSSVGFGGGSSYLALLAIRGVPFELMPIIALICNIVVVSGNSYNYIRAGFLRKDIFLPIIITSIPLAYLGGSIVLDKQIFLAILFFVLLISGINLLIQHKQYDSDEQDFQKAGALELASIGGILGLVAGITGIGGGIFLAPILYKLKACNPKQIACICSLFILVNSISGLLGQFQKTSISEIPLEFLALPIAAIIGGQIGNMLMLRFIPKRIIALLTAILVLIAANQIGLKLV
jgi:uncharacterized membrane protein YfcA